MSKIKGNESITAVAVPGFMYGDGSHEEPSVKGGLTIRQHFAAMAMQGLLSNTKNGYDTKAAVTYAENAVYLADALIAELNKDTP